MGDLTHEYLIRPINTLGDAMRLIGAYANEVGHSAEKGQARTNLFDAYELWCAIDRPEYDVEPMTESQEAQYEAAVKLALEANMLKTNREAFAKELLTPKEIREGLDDGS